jgi:hypothetical protein
MRGKQSCKTFSGPRGTEALSRRDLLKAAGSTLIATSVGGLALMRSPHVHAAPPAVATTQRPLSDFLSMQGSTSMFTPPVPDQLGWAAAVSPTIYRFAVFDYAGLANAYLGGSLGTQISGSVIERPLRDGSAEVTVILHTVNALAWATDLDVAKSLDLQFNGNDLLFGARAAGVGAGQTSALGDCHLQVVFLNSKPGADLPDLVCTNLGTCPSGFSQIFIAFSGSARGLLHAPAFPEGTPGLLSVTQTGLSLRGSGQGALGDGFPAERVELRAVGR